MIDIDEFEKLCYENPEICQEMADDGDILNPDLIKIALKNGITFKKEFLEENNIDINQHFI
jgi:hypothetical protein